MWKINLLVLMLLYPCMSNAKGGLAANHSLEGTYAKNHNGAVAEIFINTYMQTNGFGKIVAEVGPNGIDGLMYKKINGKMEVSIIESKHGLKAQLGVTKNGKQMSTEWILNAINNKRKELSKLKPDKKVQKIIDDLNEVEKVVKKDKHKKLLFRMHPLSQEYDELKELKKQTNRLKELEVIKRTRNLDKIYATNIEELDGNGDVVKGKELNRYGVHKQEIDLDASYKKGSKKWKLQKILKHADRKQILIAKKSKIISNLKLNRKKYLKKPAQFNKYTILIADRQKDLNKLKKRRPKEMYESNNMKIPKTESSALAIKKGNKVLVFIERRGLKNIKLNNFTKGSVVMIALEGGEAIYSVLDRGVTYKKVSKLLTSGSKVAAINGFSKGVAFITPPPAGLFVLMSISGAIIIDYSIDKYIELNKRNYSGIEDMLWDVPIEIKNKITSLNIADSKRKSVYDFDGDDNEVILDFEGSGKTAFDYNNNEDAILGF